MGHLVLNSLPQEMSRFRDVIVLAALILGAFGPFFASACTVASFALPSSTSSGFGASGFGDLDKDGIVDFVAVVWNGGLLAYKGTSGSSYAHQ